MITVDVAFAATWLTLASDPTSSVQLFKTDRSEQSNLAGEIRPYAPDPDTSEVRNRIIVTGGVTSQIPMTFRRVTPDTVATLRSWRGELLLLRDWNGWRRWGTFFDLQIVNYAGQSSPLYLVTLTWQDSTYVEAV